MNGLGTDGPAGVRRTPRHGDSPMNASTFPRDAAARILATAAALILAHSPAAPAADSPEPDDNTLAVVDRAVSLDRGQWEYWQVDYRLRNDQSTPLVIPPGEIAATVSGYVSNSRVPSHAAPKPSTVSVGGTAGRSAANEIITSSDESKRCRERMTLSVWAGDSAEPPAVASASASAAPATEGTEISPLDGLDALTIAPGGVARVRIRLEHEHFLYGPYNALLGPRDFELRLGPATIRDTLPLDRVVPVRRAPAAWPPAPPPELTDTRVFLSAPDSLHLEAHAAGKQSHRFERAVKYGTKMRLRFSYLIPAGTDGQCRVRIAQHKDSPTVFRTLPDGGWEQPLTVPGRWTRVDHVLSTQPDATILTLEFRLLGCDWGEMWIDDVSLEPLEGATGEP